MKEYLITVCISVYNGEKYLRRCLDSVVSQKICSMEIVLVDDGSADDTASIMYEYQAKYPEIRIRVIEQENKGLAQGRWTGVKNSSGRYITFLDVDDYLLEGAYKTILRFMEENTADIYEFQTVRSDYYSKSPYTGRMDAGKVLTDYFNGIGMPVNYWLRWFKRELFSESVFPVGISLHEDVYGFPCLLNKARTIAFIGKPLHVHTKAPGSIINSLYAKEHTREFFEKQKILLLSIPHIVSNIGWDVMDTKYAVPFSHYKTLLIRDFVLMSIEGVSYNEKLDAVIETLGLSCSRKELEKYISRNIALNCRFNRVTHRFGLRTAYRLKRLKSVFSQPVFKRICSRAARIGRKRKYRADMVLHPKDAKWFCPCCGLRFRAFEAGRFLEYPERYNPKRYVNTEQSVLCPYCGSLPRHRILASWCEKHKELLRTSKILYFAPERSMMLWMKRNGVKCTTADMLHKADLTLDIQKTGLADASYDLVIANHVLEHVNDFRKALKEIWRILRPGGIFICSFPMDPHTEILDEDTGIQTDEERYFCYGQIDHKRVFGMKADQLIAEAGFSVETVRGEDYAEDILPVTGPADYDLNRLFCCRKTRMGE